MFRLKIHDYISSAHFLDGYQGKCENLHGHNWKIEMEVKGEMLDNLGMLIDFKLMREILSGVLKELDHCVLNDHEAFKSSNPSAEVISKYIYEQVQKKLPTGVDLSSISVWEAEGSQAVYSEK